MPPFIFDIKRLVRIGTLCFVVPYFSRSQQATIIAYVYISLLSISGKSRCENVSAETGFSRSMQACMYVRTMRHNICKCLADAGQTQSPCTDPHKESSPLFPVPSFQCYGIYRPHHPLNHHVSTFHELQCSCWPWWYAQSGT